MPAPTPAVTPDVVPKIDAEDYIFQFILNARGDREAAAREYFHGGADCAAKLRSIATAYGAAPPEQLDLLEFASGSGRVTRHLTRGWKSVTASDVYASAIHFLRDTVGVEAILSDPDPARFRVDRQFDVVFALSFFSHMPPTNWTRWCATLCDVLRPGGLFIFTTQGRRGIPYLKSLGFPEASGDFWFIRGEEGAYLPPDDYGQTVVTPKFVRAVLKQIPTMREVAYTEAYWWDIQDLYVWRKS